MRYDINKDALEQYLDIKSECLRNKRLNSYTQQLFSAFASMSGAFGNIIQHAVHKGLDDEIFIGRVFTERPTMQRYNGELVLSVQSGNDGSDNYPIDTMVLSTGKYVNFLINEITQENFEIKTIDKEGVIH